MFALKLTISVLGLMLPANYQIVAPGCTKALNSAIMLTAGHKHLMVWNLIRIPANLNSTLTATCPQVKSHCPKCIVTLLSQWGAQFPVSLAWWKVCKHGSMHV